MTPRLDAALTLLLIVAAAAMIGVLAHLAGTGVLVLSDRMRRRRHRLLAESKAAINRTIAELQARADDRLDTCPDFERHADQAMALANDFPCCETDSLREQLDFQTWETEL